MSSYRYEMIARIRENLKWNLEWIDEFLHADTLTWLAESMYDELEDELRGAE